MIEERLREQAVALETEGDRAATRGDTAFAAALHFVAQAVCGFIGSPDALLADVRDFAQGCTSAARSYPQNEILEGRRRGAWRALFCLEKAARTGIIYQPPSEEGAPAPERFDVAPAHEDRGRCQGLTKAGGYCRNAALPGQQFCRWHGGAV